MSPNKRIKLTDDSDNDQHSTEEARRAEARRSATEDFDPPFDIDKEEIDKKETDEEETEVEASTPANTLVNCGYTTTEALIIALQHVPQNIRTRGNLWVLVANIPAYTADQNARGEPARPEE
ncbi:hypothetical protein diail_6490 [Diaporthe ilicicola]|nr:hypothetical protein diail_6490 [Diaporthe ilicicola]